MLAVQRSAAMLELVDLASGLCFVHSIHKGRGDILAFFFTDAPDTDMVIVTSRAVELNQFAARCDACVRSVIIWMYGLRTCAIMALCNVWATSCSDTRQFDSFVICVVRIIPASNCCLC
jgi:hypothetical protein